MKRKFTNATNLIMMSKKSILFFCAALTIFSLTAFSYINWNENKKIDIIYNVDSRFMATITKENLHKATSVLDIVPKEAEDWWKASFHTVTVAVLQDEDELREMGVEKVLNDAQIKLLQSIDYSTNFYIKARGTDIHPETGKIEDYVYYFTVIPEHEAEYTAGYDALISYLRENSKTVTASIQEDKLKPGKIYFTVTKEGTIEHVGLESTSGYPSVDEVMIELINNLPGTWKPATNSNGDKVEQKYVFSFGIMGC